MSAYVVLFQLDGSPADAALLEPMLRRIAYRGPHGQARWVSGHIAMGHSLYVTCPADIPQPFTLGHVTVVAHIRVDGRDELIPALQKIDAAVTSATPDVELLARAYLAWGDAFLDHIIGDFSFVLWDAAKQVLIGARDQFGLLPLFYAQIGNTLILSTELGALRRHPAVTTRVDEDYVGDYLIVGNPLWLDRTRTALADIKRLAPAHLLKVERGQATVRKYWTLPHDDPMLRYKTEQQYIEHFLDVFRRCVKDRMRSDKIVLALSGGLDSGTIAVMATDLIRTGQVNAELIGFTGIFDRIHPDTEAYFSSLTARRLGIPHHLFRSDDYLMQPPLSRGAEPLQTYQSGLERAYGEAVYALGATSMGGYAGDEVLWRDAFSATLASMSPRKAFDLYRWEWRFLGHRPAFGGLQYANPFRRLTLGERGEFGYAKWLNPDFEKRLRLRERYFALWDWQPEHHHELHPSAYMAITRLDRQMTTEFLDETATPPVLTSPFLDIRVTRFALTLPPLPWFEHKYLLRRTFGAALPAAVITRKKTPLGSLLNSLLYQPNTEWVNEWQPVPELNQYVRRDAIPRLSGDLPGNENLVNARPLLLNEWLRQYRD